MFLTKKNANSLIGKGSYNNQPVDSTFSVGAAALVTINDKPYSTADKEQDAEGTITIMSITDNLLKGKLNDAKLIGTYGNDPAATITLNGRFNAKDYY